MTVARRFDFWLALSVALYVLNILGWVTYAAWRTWHE